MANGMFVATKGRGSIAIETKKGRMFIRDVMLIPELDESLISLEQCIEHSYHLHLDDNTCN